MSYSLEDLKSIKAGIERLILHIKTNTVPSPTCGLCMNLCYDTPFRGSELVEEFSQGWPLHTGDNEFPVPAPDGGCYDAAYYAHNHKYAGKYGALRIQLLHYMAGRVEQKMRSIEAVQA